MIPEVISAHSVTEAFLHLLVTPCSVCRHGAREIAEPCAARDVDAVRMLATCVNCGSTEEAHYRVPAPRHAVDPLSDTAPINDSPVPSEIIDVAQWVTLYHLMLQTAEETPDRQEARWRKFRAGECLEEALKFFEPDSEVPPESAFFTDLSQKAFRDHSQRFTRQRLRGLLAMMPAIGVQDRIARQAKQSGNRWWKIWKRD